MATVTLDSRLDALYRIPYHRVLVPTNVPLYSRKVTPTHFRCVVRALCSYCAPRVSNDDLSIFSDPHRSCFRLRFVARFIKFTCHSSFTLAIASQNHGCVINNRDLFAFLRLLAKLKCCPFCRDNCDAGSAVVEGR